MTESIEPSISQSKVGKMQAVPQPSKRFEGKVVLVTGAGKGIGRRIATAFAAEGAWVAVNDITPINLDETIRQIQANSGNVKDFVADMSVKMSVQVMVDQILETWERIDILINCAEVKPTSPLLDMDAWDWQRTLDVNLSGPFYAMQAVGRAMRSQGRGVIINIFTNFGRPEEQGNRVAYITSMMGLMGLTQVAAQELAAHQIRVNAVCPGSAEIDMPARLRQEESIEAKWLEELLAGQSGIADGVVGLVLFLCSDEAAHITGKSLLTAAE